MKKLILPICLLLTGVVSANGQSFSIGVRAGLNFANIIVSGPYSTTADSRTSFLLGGYTKFMFTDKMGLQPELFYSSLGTKSSGFVQKLNYLSVPIMFRYNINGKLHFLVGPQLNILVAAKDISGGQTTDVKDAFNSTDFGGVLGVGVDFGPFNVGARYVAGFTNILKVHPSGYSEKNNVFQLVAGYKLFGK